eukprot:scaffold10312_cov149-Amphora_coffeaeformis.AAC.3
MHSAVSCVDVMHKNEIFGKELAGAPVGQTFCTLGTYRMTTVDEIRLPASKQARTLLVVCSTVGVKKVVTFILHREQEEASAHQHTKQGSRGVQSS